MEDKNVSKLKIPGIAAAMGAIIYLSGQRTESKTLFALAVSGAAAYGAAYAIDKKQQLLATYRALWFGTCTGLSGIGGQEITEIPAVNKVLEDIKENNPLNKIIGEAEIARPEVTQTKRFWADRVQTVTGNAAAPQTVSGQTKLTANWADRAVTTFTTSGCGKAA